MMSAKTLAVIVSALVLLFVLELVRRDRLTFKYGGGWIFVSLLAVFFSIFDELLVGIAVQMGFELPSNFIFFTLLCVFVFLSLLLTVFLCQQENRNNIMAQKLGIIESELMKIKNKQ